MHLYGKSAKSKFFLQINELPILDDYQPPDTPVPLTVAGLSYNLLCLDLNLRMENVSQFYKCDGKNSVQNLNQKDDKNKLSTRSCGFCKRNDESNEKYTSHSLKSSTGAVTCPVLRNYVCTNCKATGDYAHTITYCPLSRLGGRIPESNAILLKTSKYTSAGKRRY